MKKIINYKTFIAALALSIFLTSCDEIENDTDDVKYVKPIVTANQTNFSLLEGETASITLTANNAINLDMTFKLEIVGGNASFRDYTTSGDETAASDGFGPIGHIITLPAFSTTTTFDITPMLDLLTEGTENLQLRLYSDSYSRGLVEAGSEFITINVTDVVSDDLGIELDWTQEFADSFGTLDLRTYIGDDDDEHYYADYDFDIYVFDAAFNEVSGFAGATAAAPEAVTLLGSNLADGVYEIYADKYDNGADPSEIISLPMTLTVSKFGTWTKVIDVNYYNSDTAVSAPNGLNGGEFLVARFTKSGSTYTLNDPDTDEVLAQGRLAKAKQAIKNLKKNKLKIN